MEMKFRKAETSDLDTLNAISVASKSYWGYPKSWMERWHNDLILTEDNINEQKVLVAEAGNKIIGFSSIIENNDNYEILHLWILPAYIGKGFGKKLLTTTIQQFTKPDKEIIVVADPNAEPFYQSQGFVTFNKVESFPKGRFLPIMKMERP